MHCDAIVNRSILSVADIKLNGRTLCLCGYVCFKYKKKVSYKEIYVFISTWIYYLLFDRVLKLLFTLELL